MWTLSLAIWILSVSDLTHGSNKDGENSERKGLASASSMDELLEMLYPEYGLVQDCLRRRAHSTPLRGHATHHDMWGDPRQMALYKADGTFEVIMEEIQRTICKPREVCLEVSKEFPETISNFYLPRCVSVHRCGGCCNHEALHCGNTSHSMVNKTLVELSPPRMERSVIMVTFVNHTACECQAKRPLHSIIRRAALTHPSLCSVPTTVCSPGWEWDPAGCRCIPAVPKPFPAPVLNPVDAALLTLCGPNKVLDEELCQCVCANGLTEASCGPGWHLDQDSCECLCNSQPAPGACPPNQHWDAELCGCMCRATCPQNQPLNPDTCLCQCRESDRTCLLQGKKFNRDNCSCYRLPCRTPHRKCPMGYYYSHFVCHCIPSYMRSGEWN